MTSPASTRSRVQDALAAAPGGRRPGPGFAAALAVLLGVGGLWWGAAARGSGPAGPVSPATSAATAGPAAPVGTAGSATVGDIAVRGGYIREPASPDVAAAYLSITDTGSQPDTLVSVYSGAALSATLHDIGPTSAPGSTAPAPSSTAGAGHVPSGPLTLAAGATVTLAPGRGHIMLEDLTGTLRPGDVVSMVLAFQRAGQVLVDLPVIAIGAPTPTGAGS